MHQFASSLLVKDRHYGALARMVDRTYLGMKLVYHRVGARNPSAPEPQSEHTLPDKFEIKPGDWAKWLNQELRQRFDNECVDSAAQFGSFKRAVTIAGQIKHYDSRHEKDDRKSISNRRF